MTEEERDNRKEALAGVITSYQFNQSRIGDCAKLLSYGLMYFGECIVEAAEKLKYRY